MSLKPFTYPFPETRFLHAGPNVYKFKIRYGNSIRGEEIENKEVIVRELEVLAEKKSAETMMRKRRHTEVPSSPRKSGPDSSKVGTSSQGPSKKKPPMETMRNMEGKTQQEQQETPAFDVTDVQEQGPKWGDSLAGQMTPSLQQNNLPPPKGPTELGTTGFFGFLSTVFPFSYFFRRNSQ
ncbi:membrane-anchored junction protein isoform X2 [Trichechus manatus latirostris]|uniref:Membrane-anchored junction protein isoform X2 n=1 Tax=Trichechus manatus latirostris TaxID=127582 RepID=A0A2Y9FZC0_TRIMA|nr:membrane-anchored junction protein isoform X2 [Trichechus manatus latirostris]